jgi:putative transposase
VKRSQDWPWSSLASTKDSDDLPVLTPSPVERPSPWTRWVNQPLTDTELLRVRSSVERGSPFGSATWAKSTAQRLGLESALRPLGRPRETIK